MKVKYYTCDVFTDTPFGGNQLAVFPDASLIPEDRLQQIAKEFNFSETTFVYPPNDPINTKRLRIFTPGNELPFAGHPTVGTAMTLGSIGEIPLSSDFTKITFEEGVGPVPVTIHSKNGSPEFAQLTAAIHPEFNDQTPSVEELSKLFTLDVDEFDVTRYPLEFVSVGFPFLYVALKKRSSLERIRVNVQVMEELQLNEVFVFTDDTGSADVQFRARMFAPLLGIPEDPATGSACASFSGYLAEKHAMKTGTLKWNVAQGIEMGRPSALFIEADKSNGTITAVRVGGSTVMMSEGFFNV